MTENCEPAGLAAAAGRRQTPEDARRPLEGAKSVLSSDRVDSWRRARQFQSWRACTGCSRGGYVLRETRLPRRCHCTCSPLGCGDPVTCPPGIRSPSPGLRSSPTASPACGIRRTSCSSSRPSRLANNLTVLLAFIIAGLGAGLLGRRLTGDATAGVVAGIAFMGCGYLFGHLVHQGILDCADWLPWILLGLDLCLERLSATRVALGSLAVGMAALSGQFQVWATVLAGVAIYAIACALFDHRIRLRAPAVAAMLIGIGTCLAAVQLAPTLALVRSDPLRISYSMARSYSFPLSHLPLLIFPYLFGSASHTFPYRQPYRGLWNLDELNGYFGTAALTFVAAGIPSILRDARARALAAVGVAGLLLASAGAWPLGHLLYLVPIYGNFRDWARYILLSDLAVALLAAYGVRDLRSADRHVRLAALRRAATVPLLIALAAATVHLIEPFRRLEARGLSGLAAVGVPLAAAVGGLIACAALARRVPAASAIAALVVGADLVLSFGGWRVGGVTAAAAAASLSPDAAPSWGVRPSTASGIERFLVVSTGAPDSTISYPDVSDAQGLRSANGYVPLGLAPTLYTSLLGSMDNKGDIADPAVLWTNGSHILDLLRIRTLLVDPAGVVAVPPNNQSLLSGPFPVPDSTLERYEHALALADAFVVPTARAVSSAEMTAAVYGQTDFDPSSVALVEQVLQGVSRWESGEWWNGHRRAVE